MSASHLSMYLAPAAPMPALSVTHWVSHTQPATCAGLPLGFLTSQAASRLSASLERSVLQRQRSNATAPQLLAQSNLHHHSLAFGSNRQHSHHHDLSADSPRGWRLTPRAKRSGPKQRPQKRTRRQRAKIIHHKKSVLQRCSRRGRGSYRQPPVTDRATKSPDGSAGKRPPRGIKSAA